MKKTFITGLIILVPLAITGWVLHLVVSTMDQVLLLLPLSWRESALVLRLPGVGVVLTMAIVLLVGLLARNFIGRRLLVWWEHILAQIPIVRSVYSSVKQVSDTVLKPNGQAFRKAVLIEFPRAGAWTVGFVVGTPGSEIESHMANLGCSGPAQTVFVPTAPNPTSGYIVVLPPEQIRELDMSVDAALKFIISLGVVKPDGAAIDAVAVSVPSVVTTQSP